MKKKMVIYFLILLLCGCQSKKEVSNNNPIEQEIKEDKLLILDVEKDGLLFSNAKIDNEDERVYNFELKNVSNNNINIKCIGVQFYTDSHENFYTFNILVDEELVSQQVVGFKHMLDNNLDEEIIDSVDYILSEQC